MAVSKKIRFEVFKRDGFVCSYCGSSPPLVTLEIDHINPKSRGGIDDINNLITACFDCNRGKKNIPLEKIPSKLNDNLEILKEKEIQLKEYNRFIAKIEKRLQADIEEINDLYSSCYDGYEFTERFKAVSIKRFLSFLPKSEISESLLLAASRFPNNQDKAIKYFCGICWNKIKGKGRPAYQ
jgi:hypothetical protein